MWKYCMFVIALIGILAICPGCAGNKAESNEGKIVNPVAALELIEKEEPIMLHYSGTVEAKEVVSYSFLAAGKIARVFVEEGQLIRKGDNLALLQQEELEVTALEADKAKANYEFIGDYYLKMKTLQEEGFLAEQELKEVDLELKQAEYSWEQAKKTLDISNDNFIITADIEGYVLSIINKENETVTAGSPVVIVGSLDMKGQIGLSEKDAAKVKTGDEVKVVLNEAEIRGTITTIQKIPDKESRAYMADIVLEQPPVVNYGSLIKVEIPAGSETGIWVPLQYILNDGEDYVFVIEDGRAKRKNVQLGSLLEDRVCVEGLQKGDILITDGIKSVKDGYVVEVIK